jgi:hypothetical protein
MFLTSAAQAKYSALQNALQEAADADPALNDAPLTSVESQRLS